MSDKPTVIIGAGPWFCEKNTGRIGIYNANYVAGFAKIHDRSKPWTLASVGGSDLNGENFETQQAAATFVREYLSKAKP